MGRQLLKGPRLRRQHHWWRPGACDPKQVREGSVRLDGRAREGPGGPRGVRESWGAGLRSGQSTARASPHCSQFPLPRLGQPGVIHSQPGDSLRGSLLAAAQIPAGDPVPPPIRYAYWKNRGGDS